MLNIVPTYLLKIDSLLILLIRGHYVIYYVVKCIDEHTNYGHFISKLHINAIICIHL